ncbi:hypothetical protein RB195_012253 [Necator americanus]|uniref:Reverse transcriptase domain-containing protein n=1 Tax=Necator americanus TaxID=51031 RepID=A0ABR1D679_NECAM
MEKIIYDFYRSLRQPCPLASSPSEGDGHVIPAVLPSEIRHAIMSVRNRTAAGPDRIKPEHRRTFRQYHQHPGEDLTRYLSECKAPNSETSKTVLLKRRSTDIGNYRPICLRPSSTSSPRVILNRIEKVLDEDNHASKQGFEKDSARSTISHCFETIEVSREYKMPPVSLHRLEEGLDSVETEAVVEALDNQGVPTQYIKVLRELYSNFTTGISPSTRISS